MAIVELGLHHHGRFGQATSRVRSKIQEVAHDLPLKARETFSGMRTSVEVTLADLAEIRRKWGLHWRVVAVLAIGALGLAAGGCNPYKAQAAQVAESTRTVWADKHYDPTPTSAVPGLFEKTKCQVKGRNQLRNIDFKNSLVIGADSYGSMVPVTDLPTLQNNPQLSIVVDCDYPPGTVIVPDAQTVAWTKARQLIKSQINP